jgi:hypothetical protein
MQSKATTVDQYLAELPDDRREALMTIRAAILKNLPKGYEEGMQYGMIGYYVPHSVYPPGYHCDPSQPLPYVCLASQKQHMALYMGLYMMPELDRWFRDAWAKSGKKLDMGKSCIRFKKLEDLPLKIVGEAVRRVPVKAFIAQYESSLADVKSRKPVARKKAAAANKKPAVKKKSSARKKPLASAKKKK